MANEKYSILVWTFYRLQFSVLELCENLHMYVNGGIDCYEPLTPYVSYSFLKKRLEYWIKSESQFDGCVKKLIEASVFEYENSDMVPDYVDAYEFLFKNPKSKIHIKNRIDPRDVGE